MKAIIAGIAIVLLGSFVGCASNQDETGRGGPRQDWNSTQSDPVCGMTVNPKTAYTRTFDGRRYYFETEECARKFRDNPSAFVSPGDPRTAEERRHHEVR